GWDAFKQEGSESAASLAQTAGYETALIGKYINRYGKESTVGAWLSWAGRYLNIDFSGPNAGTPREWVPPGWTLWYAFTGYSRVKYYDYSINENGRIRNFGDEPADYSTDVLRE